MDDTRTTTPHSPSSSSPQSAPASAPVAEAKAQAPASQPPTAAQWGAEIIDRHVIPSALHLVLGMNLVSAGAAVHYMADLAASARDPVEKMLLEGLVLAHHRLAQLHVSAAKATQVEAIRVYNAAAARLMGEIRRTALALRLYRQPAGQKSFSVINQQNVVAGGQQAVSYLDGVKGQATLRVRDELNSQPFGGRMRHVADPVGQFPEEPEASSCREGQLAAAGALDG